MCRAANYVKRIRQCKHFRCGNTTARRSISLGPDTSCPLSLPLEGLAHTKFVKRIMQCKQLRCGIMTVRSGYQLRTKGISLGPDTLRPLRPPCKATVHYSSEHIIYCFALGPWTCNVVSAGVPAMTTSALVFKQLLEVIAKDGSRITHIGVTVC
jgi:hypothetical protein